MKRLMASCGSSLSVVIASAYRPSREGRKAVKHFTSMATGLFATEYVTRDSY
ncbi:MAG: hypothetical protein KAW39_03120 [Thermoplasmata archaeon]|nr:hypothetical protein [Thermoplasmata archaeon]